MRIIVDTKEAQLFEDSLRLLRVRGIPYAARNTLNVLAFDARAGALSYAKQDMTLRNKWTERGFRVDKARGFDLQNMYSVAGNVRQYMATQEHGGVVTPDKGKAVSIPTPFASGETRTRQRNVKPRHRVSNIKLARRKVAAKSSKQRNAIKISMAARSGQKHVFLAGIKSPGYYAVTGGRKSIKPRLVQNMAHPSVTIKPTRILLRASSRATRNTFKIYSRELKRQLLRM